jgi:hypothetical protein
MATATVFVDDAVLGHLPGVCVKTGVPTDDHMSLTTGVGNNNGFGFAWLLILAGPLGWIGLFIFAATRREEVLTVRLPYCEPAYKAYDEVRHFKRVAGYACLALVAAAPISFRPLGRTAMYAFLVAAGIAFCVFVFEAIKARRGLVDVRLDGSRRWVTLNRVHSEFADAVTESQRDRVPSPH